MNLAAPLERRAALSPRKTAIHFKGDDLSYRELWDRIERATRSIDAVQGDRVAWRGFNHPDMLVLLFALSRLGAMLVPLNWRLTESEQREILLDCSPKLVVDGVDLHQDINSPVKGKEASPALIVYTSGTTGRPKGAVLTQAALLANAENSVWAHALTPEDHVLTALPMFHVGGLNIQTLPALLAGATVTLHERFDPGLWLADVAARRPTLSLLVPAAMRAVISHPDWPKADLSSLRLLNSGSMVVPDSLILAFHERGVPVGQIYGTTETAPIATALLREDAMRRVGSAGKPAPRCEVKLVDGEIWVRGPAVMRGYWKNGGGLTPEGWFRSGDLARIDEDGFYWITGRSKDVIISGGENIHPAELENVLADCPAIAEAAVVGIADERWGEAACACVVRKEGTFLDEKQVHSLFENRLARYKHPRRVVFLDALPRNAMGKVMKAELKKRIGA